MRKINIIKKKQETDCTVCFIKRSCNKRYADNCLCFMNENDGKYNRNK